MADRNGGGTKTRQRQAQPQSRITDETEAVRAAAEQAEQEEDEARERLTPFLRDRQQSRRTQANEEKARSLDEAVVTTGKGLPDMRFAENRNKFMHDPLKKVTGRPDNRFVENRPDILKVHLDRGDDKPNVIFGDDGQVEE